MRSIRLFDLLMGFSRALDMVSPVLAGHHLRVAFLAQALAERLQLSHATRKYMLMASMLHDIGAIPLKSDTRDLIFEHNKALHCRAGWAFCKTAGLPRAVCDMVLNHHTEWCSYGEDDQNALPANCIHLADRLDVALRNKHASDLNCICATLQTRQREYAPACLNVLGSLADDAELVARLASPQNMQIHLASLFGSVILGPVQLVDLCGLFSQTIDSKSPFTATHSLGVAHTARMLLKLSRMADEGDLTTMFIAGLLHDIGKLAIPHEILEKPAALTPEELSLIQQHAQTSLDLLGSIPGFTCVRDWGGRHHERLDGTGYPHGISGPSLSLPVRIIAVADVFTALTEDRPYRAGMPLAQAMGIIQSMAELSYLDANVVALLADNVVRVNRARIRAQRRAAANFVVMRRLCGDTAGAA
ncbi:MAG: HD domain-containing protein [Desulfovibrio sp.]|uniref:HD domain-containing phosphohydrolase n=1 Tax=Desulfovibrio sp. TaxID=885 RepID=UPI00135E1F85|nr:HD domain-containing phosphohydrolase [Desulfovibrio sp.]MTJ92852.1 HD domain-containing protein [Desulfovibrio sp.]